MGTFTFGGAGRLRHGGQPGRAEAERLVGACLEGGVNLFDTSNMYSLGLSEEILAEALGARRARRAHLVQGPHAHRRGAERRGRVAPSPHPRMRAQPQAAQARPHRHLLHARMGRQTPLDEMLSALDNLVRQGKIRYIGCSNYSGWHIMKALGVSDLKGHPRFVTQQIHYTLEAREAEYELLPISVDQGLGVLIWSPLAAGLLSGAHRRDRPVPPGSRQAKGGRNRRSATSSGSGPSSMPW